MRTRHRIPTIFSLSMVDVLCCALGCIILLWLLNFWVAQRRTEAAGKTHSQLVETQNELTAALQSIDELQKQLLTAEQLAATLEKDRKAIQLQAMEAARTRDKLQLDLKNTQALLNSTQTKLDLKTKEELALAKSLAGLKLKYTTVDDLLAKKMKAILAAEKQIKALQLSLQKQMKLAKTLAKGADDIATRLRLSQQKLIALQKELTDQRALTTQANRLRLAAENRFAGITLTGKKVIFLVDMSGSMELIDGKTPAPAKWEAARETIAKVIRSLPDLERFQVILFATEPSYPLGSAGEWIVFDAIKSVDQVLQSLAKVKPKGNTNMYAAFDTAFQFRNAGLDTIYIISDGLPNIGPGLPATGVPSLTDTQRASLLARHVRSTLRQTWNRPLIKTPRVKINAIGFFYESPDVGAFLWALARENDGSFVGMSKP